MNIKVEVITNMCLVFNIDNQLKIAMDPALSPKGTSIGFGIKSKFDPVYNEQTFQDVNLWLLTHNHKDHLDDVGLTKIKSDDLILAPKSMGKQLSNNNKNNVNLIKWNETKQYEFNDYKVKITAIPAFHGHNGLVRKLMGEVNGYIIEITNNETTRKIFLTGDTILNDQYRQIIERNANVDLLVMTVGGATPPLPISKKKITLTAAEAHEVAKIMQAKYTIGVHIDEYEHFTTTRSEISQIADVIELGTTKIYDLS